ncbi:hypothetical protein D560_2455 [Bordetella holmesii ATCC 51541]|nr:hypothetical protein D560_2455 [Bordetella holmesii ATCC 51541]EWM47677.1 hypothetical protein D555_2468 [Bordetella holmesii 35009]
MPGSSGQCRHRLRPEAIALLLHDVPVIGVRTPGGTLSLRYG